ncbi:type 1 glutamine amidotransferase [Aliikangiella coralliicola]|uniref:Type 1 glutamine amidotransferase n=1 Tax=Aliikangiella coralliicola TaxID=2592383 RepID=A0A545UEA2_9GAMM|nr:type 1 glutamine amidotransferase [Aliikangiella coralliicola]TQV87806.1 type 1 glutamine amidotransferase [Aliikangiella coralliicola]
MQIRKSADIAQEELCSFSEHAQLSLSQIETLNVFDRPSFDESVLAGYDSLWVGGASDANVLQPDDYPFVIDAQKLLLHCCEKGLPVFASCFGFQLAVLALGGSIIESEGEFEMGTIPISLSNSAAKDTLLKDIPEPFLAVSVHKQKAVELPQGCELLAYTEQCVHGIKVKNKPFWAFQFHPEINKSTLVQRLTFYKNCYTENESQLEHVIASARETPESNSLMKKFVDRVLLC